MARYIDVDKLYNALTYRPAIQGGTFTDYFCNYVNNNIIGFIKEAIENQPIADVVEVRHGEWIYNTDDFTPKMRCSACGYNKPVVAGENVNQEPSDYCNKCGAKMDGGKE